PIQLQRGAQLRGRPPHPFRDRPHLAVGLGQKGEDPVRLAVVELAQHDRAVTIGGQFLPPPCGGSNLPAPSTRAATALRRSGARSRCAGPSPSPPPTSRAPTETNRPPRRSCPASRARSRRRSRSRPT